MDSPNWQLFQQIYILNSLEKVSEIFIAYLDLKLNITVMLAQLHSLHFFPKINLLLCNCLQVSCFGRTSHFSPS